MITVKLPCRFGDTYGNIEEPLVKVNWFQWCLFGCEFTYLFKRNNNFSTPKILTVYEDQANNYLIRYKIKDKYLIEGPLKEKGLPLKGDGYVTGLYYDGDSIYFDVYYTGQYGAHIYVEVNETMEYTGGKIITPPTWTKEKTRKLLLKKYQGIKIGAK